MIVFATHLMRIVDARQLTAGELNSVFRGKDQRCWLRGSVMPEAPSVVSSTMSRFCYRWFATTGSAVTERSLSAYSGAS
jgi:hypothetical protein